jgi:hypothetical protein
MGICRRLCRPAGAWRRWSLRHHRARFLTKRCRGHNRTAARTDLARPGRDQGSRPLSVPARYAAFSSAPRWLTWARAWHQPRWALSALAQSLSDEPWLPEAKRPRRAKLRRPSSTSEWASFATEMIGGKFSAPNVGKECVSAPPSRSLCVPRACATPNLHRIAGNHFGTIASRGFDAREDGAAQHRRAQLSSQSVQDRTRTARSRTCQRRHFVASGFPVSRRLLSEDIMSSQPSTEPL